MILGESVPKPVQKFGAMCFEMYFLLSKVLGHVEGSILQPAARIILIHQGYQMGAISLVSSLHPASGFMLQIVS